MPWTFYNSNGQRLSSAATNISVLDIDGATDIGAAIVDADLFIIDDGAGGTNRKTAASRIATYIAAPTEASQANMESKATGTLYVPPDLMRHSPNAASGWYKFPGGSGTSFSENENMASMTHPSAGVYTGNFTTPMDGDNLYCTIVSVESAAAGQIMSGYHMYSGGVSAYGAYHIVNEGSTTHVDLPHSVVFFGTLNTS